jgi:hypothetical protein
MAHSGNVGTERRAANIVQRGRARLLGYTEDDRLEPGQDGKAGGLPQWHQPHGGGDEIRRERLQVSGDNCVMVDTMSARERPNGNRIRHWIGQRRTGPSRRGAGESSPLIERFGAAFARRRHGHSEFGERGEVRAGPPGVAQ